MIEEIKSIQENTLVYELTDSITQLEIEIMDIGIEKALEMNKKVNLVLHINADEGNLASFVKEIQLGLKYWNKINKIAFIGDHKNWSKIVVIDNIFTKFKEKYFDINEVDEAWKWVSS